MTDHDDSAIREDIATIKETMRWHKWLLFAVVAMHATPILGAPGVPQLEAIVYHALV